MAEQLQDAEVIFFAALERLNPAERAAYVEGACAGDAALLARVRKLLAFHDETRGPLDAAPPGCEGPENERPPESAGTVIGPYKLVQAIGEGGMGTVWMAQQTQPVKRLVALKVIKPGMDSRQVLARFEAERQALALMDHPNIARVLDAQATPGGRPYFVMELVKGAPLTKYCDEHRLTPRQRLELFIPVCQAIQHAHQKGIIHRDIKPSNVLVALYDGKPVPKVIDFGIAKATGQQLTDRTLVTGFGNVVGTLEYMSPEQAEVNQLDIDTRSDIYSLGVLLYELLTGTTPLEKKRLAKAAMLEVLRMIREVEPPRPSTRLSESKESLPSISAQRQLEPAKLTKLVRGELDWIVMKALEKDRNRRYETANGFALDIQRYLADEPVQAAPPSAWYRFRKFALRNKVALTAGAAVAAALVLAVMVLAVSVVLVRQEQAATDQARGEKEEEYQGRITALEGETRALGREKEALESWRQSSYSMGITLALNEYQAANTIGAGAILDELPEDLRRWEWHYMKRLVRSELTTCKVTPIPIRRAFGPNGDRVAIVDQGLTTHLYDCASAKELPGFRDAVMLAVDPAFSADGRYVAFGGASQKGFLIKVRDAKTGKVMAVKEFAKDTNGKALEQLSSLALSPKGDMAAVTDYHGHLFVWEVASGKDLCDVVPHPSAYRELPSTTIAFNHDGTRLATACEREAVIKIWDPKTGKQVEALDPAEGFSAVVYSPKGRWVGATGRFKYDTPASRVMTVSIWDTSTRKRRHILIGHTAAVTCLAFSPDEQLLATGSLDQRVMLWDLTTGRRVAAYCGQYGGVFAVSFCAGGKQIASLGANSLLKTWDATRPPEFLLLKRDLALVSAMFTPDGRQIASLERDPPRGSSVRIWDATSAAEVERARFETPLNAIALDPSGQRIAAGGLRMENDLIGLVSVWDRSLGKVVRTYPAAGEDLIGPVQAVAYSPDGKLLAAAGWDRLVHVWDATTGIKKLRLAGHETTVLRLAFSRDGRRLTSVSWPWHKIHGDFPKTNLLRLRSDDYTKPFEVRIWDTATGGELHTMTWPSDRWEVDYSGLQLSPDGEFVTVRTSDTSATLYQMPTRKELLVLKGLTRRLGSVTVSRDGQRIVTGGDLLRVWDAHTGRLILTVGDQSLPIGTVAFSPDDRKVLSVGMEDLRIWDATPLKL
jgi:WD40 repeat protein/serine/threonine protein kinase